MIALNLVDKSSQLQGKFVSWHGIDPKEDIYDLRKNFR